MLRKKRKPGRSKNTQAASSAESSSAAAEAEALSAIVNENSHASESESAFVADAVENRPEAATTNKIRRKGKGPRALQRPMATDEEIQALAVRISEVCAAGASNVARLEHALSPHNLSITVKSNPKEIKKAALLAQDTSLKRGVYMFKWPCDFEEQMDNDETVTFYLCKVGKAQRRYNKKQWWETKTCIEYFRDRYTSDIIGKQFTRKPSLPTKSSMKMQRWTAKDLRDSIASETDYEDLMCFCDGYDSTSDVESQLLRVLQDMDYASHQKIGKEMVEKGTHQTGALAEWRIIALPAFNALRARFLDKSKDPVRVDEVIKILTEKNMPCKAGQKMVALFANPEGEVERNYDINCSVNS